MVQIVISKDLKSVSPDLALGIIQAPVRVSRENKPLWKEISFIASRLSRKSVDEVNALLEIKAVRETYRRIGKDPSRYRGSAEALLRRLVTGKGLYKVNNIVDVNNFISLESFHPVGSYDVAHITSPVEFRIGREGESYKGIGKEVINIAELPVFADLQGPFGSPTSDSERAMITESTKEVMMVIISFIGTQCLMKHVERAKGLLSKYAKAPLSEAQMAIVE